MMPLPAGFFGGYDVADGVEEGPGEVEGLDRVDRAVTRIRDETVLGPSALQLAKLTCPNHGSNRCSGWNSGWEMFFSHALLDRSRDES